MEAQIKNILVDVYNIVTYSYGYGANTVLLLNGDPGLPYDYLRDSHICLANKGCRVVAFDQLGGGKSDKPDDPILLNITRYVEEVEKIAQISSSISEGLEHGPYMEMQGLNEILYIGNLKDWSRISEINKLKISCLIITGTHDEIGPACAAGMDNVLSNSRVVVFPNSSHIPFYEVRDIYFPVLENFLKNEAGSIHLD